MPLPLFIPNGSYSGKSAVAADMRWLETADGDWDTGANWSSAAKPSNSVTARFSEGSVDVDSGLSQSSVTVGELLFGEGYTGSVASSGSPLQINAATVRIRKRLGSVNLSGTFPNVFVYRTDAGDDAVTVGGTIGRLVVTGGPGKVTVSASSVLNSVYAINRDPKSSVRIVLGASITNNDPLATTNNRILRIIAVGSVEIVSETGGEDVQVYDGARVKFTGAAAHVNVDVRRRGVVHHTSSGKIDGRLSVYPDGAFQAWGNENNGVTIDDATIAGGVCDLRTGGDPVVVTNDVDIEGRGRLLVPSGQTMTP